MFTIKDDELSFHFRGKEIPVTISFQHKDKLDIKVTPEQKILIKVPTGKQVSEIKAKIQSKTSWILRQLDFFDNNPQPNTVDDLKSGSSFRLLGYDYLVIIDKGLHGKIEITGKFVNIFVQDPSDFKAVNSLFEKWKKQRALEIITPIYDKCFSLIHKYDIEWTPFLLRKMGSRWGSCTPEGVIYINPDLIAFPTHLIEYAVLHELCHLVYKSHDKKFYSLVELMMPDWRDREKELKAV